MIQTTNMTHKVVTKYQTAVRVNQELAEMIKAGGGGAHGNTASMFLNANKDLRKAMHQLQQACYNGLITKDEYQQALQS